jgi:hypothetical protein
MVVAKELIAKRLQALGFHTESVCKAALRIFKSPTYGQSKKVRLAIKAKY